MPVIVAACTAVVAARNTKTTDHMVATLDGRFTFPC
jgi:hypothetical protein